MALITFMIGWGLGFFILLGLYLSLYYYLRKKEPPYLEDQENSKTLIHSPISGKVLEVNKNFNHPFLGKDLVQLRLVLPTWKELGIVAPFTSEVKNFKKNRGEALFRWAKKDLPIAINDKSHPSYDNKFYSFEDKKGQEIGIEFVRCSLGLSSKVWVLPGDRVRGRAHIGYFPFGGSVFLYLPNYFEILVNKGETLISGETIIAGIPDQSC